MNDRCGKCHRALKDPKSKERGFGPICWGKIKSNAPAVKPEPRQIELHFEPNRRLFSSEQSLNEQHKIAKRLLDM